MAKVELSSSDLAPAALKARSGTVPSVEKAVKILNLLAAEGGPMTLARLSTSAGLAKSTTSALCTSLVTTRMVNRREDGRYELGPHVVELSRAYMSQIDLPDVFQRACAETRILPLETLVLAVLDGTDVVYLSQRRGERPLGVTYEIGLRLPAHCTASGKCLLSWRSPESVRKAYRQKGSLPPLTEHSVTSVEGLVEQLGAIREQGYAIDREETAIGMVCVGAPVMAAPGEPVAAAAVSLVAARITSDEMLAEVVNDMQVLVASMSGLLGGHHLT